MTYELKTKKLTKRTCIEEHWKYSIQVFKMFDLNQNMNVWSLQNYPSFEESFTLCGCETDNSKMTKTTLQCFPTFDLIIKVCKDCSNRKVILMLNIQSPLKGAIRWCVLVRYIKQVLPETSSLFVIISLSILNPWSSPTVLGIVYLLPEDVTTELMLTLQVSRHAKVSTNHTVSRTNLNGNILSEIK